MTVPPQRPAQHPEKTAMLLLAQNVREPVALLGVRGYYRASMGDSGCNDRGIYDDAIFVASPSCHVAFNANTDPSVQRPGVAVLDPGVWRYKLGIHGLSKPVERQYQALVQADEVRVTRDGGRREGGYFGINIHRGGEHETSSLGCQTIYKPQWAEFINLVRGQLERYQQVVLPYLLTEYQG